MSCSSKHSNEDLLEMLSDSDSDCESENESGHNEAEDDKSEHEELEPDHEDESESESESEAEEPIEEIENEEEISVDKDVELPKQSKFSTIWTAFLKRHKKRKVVVPDEKKSRKKTLEYLDDIIDDYDRTKTLERYIFKYVSEKYPNWSDILFRKAYFAKVRSIAFNLQNKNNPKFLERFENHEVSVKKLPYMTSYEIFPEMYEPIFEKVARRKMPKEPDRSVDGLFKCGKCKTMKTTFYCLQTRSADEPMTAYINCLNCGNRWKE